MNWTDGLAGGLCVFVVTAAALVICHAARAEDGDQANVVRQDFAFSHDQCRVRGARMIVGGRDYPENQWFSGHWAGKAFALALQPGKEPKLRQIALNEKVRLPAAADSPRLISGEQLGGRARYVFLVTPSWWPGAMRRAGDWPPGDLWT